MIIDNSFASKNTFLHVDHDNNDSCDSYIVEFIHDTTKNYYERGTHAYRYVNNSKVPLFMLKILNDALVKIRVEAQKRASRSKYKSHLSLPHFLCKGIL